MGGGRRRGGCDSRSGSSRSGFSEVDCCVGFLGEVEASSLEALLEVWRSAGMVIVTVQWRFLGLSCEFRSGWGGRWIVGDWSSVWDCLSSYVGKATCIVCETPAKTSAKDVLFVCREAVR